MADKQQHFHEAATSPWYAACETGHPFWSGPERQTYKDAKKDATDHDTATHGGDETAVVLGGRTAEELITVIVIEGGEVTKEPLSSALRTRRTSEAKYCTDGTLSFPNISITGRTVKVVRHDHTGGGEVTRTFLKGPGGQFGFPRPGVYSIEPGQYTHYVDGHIGGVGCISSTIEYS